MYPGVELRLYRYVVVLAEELNFTRAALRLHVAQPSLSKQIRELEDYLGAQLFERTKREVRLTAAREAFAAEARLTLFHAERAVQGARGEGPAQGTLEHRILATYRSADSVQSTAALLSCPSCSGRAPCQCLYGRAGRWIDERKATSGPRDPLSESRR